MEALSRATMVALAIDHTTLLARTTGSTYPGQSQFELDTPNAALNCAAQFQPAKSKNDAAIHARCWKKLGALKYGRRPHPAPASLMLLVSLSAEFDDEGRLRRALRTRAHYISHNSSSALFRSAPRPCAPFGPGTVIIRTFRVPADREYEPCVTGARQFDNKQQCPCPAIRPH